jgi:hypothetical protein
MKPARWARAGFVLLGFSTQRCKAVAIGWAL